MVAVRRRRLSRCGAPTLSQSNDAHWSTYRLHFVCMASEDTTTVRVRRPDSERLQLLAAKRQTTVIEVLHSAIDALERQEFLRGVNQDYQHLRDDPELWQRYLAERQEWDYLA